MILREPVQKWLAALRSGKYKQTKGTLHYESLKSTFGPTLNRYVDGGYCCLGVACDLAVQEGVIPPPTFDRSGHAIYAEATAALPPEVRDWLGLCNHSGAAQDNISLIYMNDDGDKTFAEIADFIESNPPGLFCPPKE